jgi:hypothetical protein
MGSAEAQPRIRDHSLAGMSNALPAQHIQHGSKDLDVAVFIVNHHVTKRVGGVEILNSGTK